MTYQKLFDYLYNEHEIILTESEMQELIFIVKEILVED